MEIRDRNERKLQTCVVRSKDELQPIERRETKRQKGKRWTETREKDEKKRQKRMETANMCGSI